MIKNYKILGGLKIVNNVIDLFISTFFVMYFLRMSNNNIVPLAIYYLIVYITVYVTIFILRNFCKLSKRIYLFRIGIILNFVYFLLIYFLKENIVNYAWLMGIIYGIQQGFYFSVYNNFESTGVKNEQRKKFLGEIYAAKSILSIVIPLAFGSIMNIDGFDKCVLIVLCLVFLQIIMSFLFKDITIKEKTKTNLKEFVNLIAKNDKLKKLYRMEFVNGAIYSGAFKSIVTIYIIRVLKNSLSYGIFTSVFALIVALVGFFFARLAKPKHYTIYLCISGVLTVLGLILIIFKCNFVTIIIFNFIQSYSQTICELINTDTLHNTSNIEEVKNKFKVEYFLGMETVLVAGRVLSYSILLILGFLSDGIWANVVLVIFALIVVIYIKSSIDLQKLDKTKV